MNKNIMEEKELKLRNEIEELEKEVIMYLEADKNSQANRIRRKIYKKELEIQILHYDDLQNELAIYKQVVRNYPGIQSEIKHKLADNGLNKENSDLWID